MTRGNNYYGVCPLTKCHTPRDKHAVGTSGRAGGIKQYTAAPKLTVAMMRYGNGFLNSNISSSRTGVYWAKL